MFDRSINKHFDLPDLTIVAVARDEVRGQLRQPVSAQRYLLGHTIRFLGIKVDDALKIAEQVDV
jgi:hypothetical protein